MDGDALGRLHDRLVVLVREHLLHFEQRFGYPAGENSVARVRDADRLDKEFEARLPTAVVEFFRHFERIWLPDFWNGYFVGPASQVVDIHRHEEPRWVQIGSTRFEVAVIGSDGGGTAYAVPLESGQPVLSLPPSGIEQGVYEPWPEQDIASLTIAADFDDFLLKLVDGIEGLVRRDEPGPFHDW